MRWHAKHLRVAAAVGACVSVSGCQPCGSAQQAEHDVQAVQAQVRQAESEAQTVQSGADQAQQDAEHARAAADRAAQSPSDVAQYFASTVAAIAKQGSDLVQGFLGGASTASALQLDRYGANIASQTNNPDRDALALACDKRFLRLSPGQRQNVEAAVDGDFPGRRWSELETEQKLQVAPKSALFSCVSSGLTQRAPTGP